MNVPSIIPLLALPAISVVLGCCGGSGAQPDPTVLSVATRCPGLDAETVEWTVTQPLELATIGVIEAERIESLSMDGLSIIDLTLDTATDRFLASELIMAALGDAMLHDDCRPLAIGLGDPRGRTVVEVALTGEGAAVEAAAHDLRRDWLTVPGVDAVHIRGLPARTVRIEVDARASAAHGVGVIDVVSAVQAATPGSADTLGAVDLGETGHGATVADVATIVLDQRHDCGRSWLDGDPAVVLSVTRTPESEARQLEPAALAALDDWRAREPASVQATILDDADLVVELDGLAPLHPSHLEAITTTAENLGPDQGVMELGGWAPGTAECGPISTRGRLSLSWLDEEPPHARSDLQRAVDSMPGLSGPVVHPADSAVEVMVTAEDLAALDELVAEVHEQLSTVPGLLQTWDDSTPPVQKVLVAVDREHAAAFGLKASQVEQAALAAREGVLASQVAFDGAPASIVVTVGGYSRDDLPTLLREVTVHAGEPRAAIPLQHLTRVQIVEAASSIRRVDLRRSTTIHVRHEPRTAASVRESIATALSELQLPAGSSVSVER